MSCGASAVRKALTCGSGQLVTPHRASACKSEGKKHIKKKPSKVVKLGLKDKGKDKGKGDNSKGKDKKEGVNSKDEDKGCNSKGTNKAKESVNKTRQRGFFVGVEEPLGLEERRAMQTDLKACSNKLIAMSTDIPGDATKFEALTTLAPTVGLEPDVLMITIKDFVSYESGRRPHGKRVAFATMACERKNDIYRIYNGNKKQLLMVSNNTHGKQNAALACKVLLVACVVGFSSEEVTDIKFGLCNIARRAVNNM